MSNRFDKYEYHRKRVNKNARWLANYKATQGCLTCGEDCPANLDFHHHSGTKTLEMARVHALGPERIQEEIDKCLVLCANCHRKVNAGLIVFV